MEGKRSSGFFEDAPIRHEFDRMSEVNMDELIEG